MTRLTVLISCLLLMLGCSKTSTVDPNTSTTTAPSPPTTNPTGQWTATRSGGGFNNFDSFKNYQYTFEVVGDNQPVSIALTSPDINVQYGLFNPLGQRIDIQGYDRAVSSKYSLNAGVYRVVVTADRRAIGKFSLVLTGTKDGASLIASQQLPSDTQTWGKLGGGGLEKTFRNHFYTFEVTDDNTTVDIELSSADTDIALFLYDALGERVAVATGNRYQFMLRPVKKGTYTVMAGTYTRGSVGNYQLNLFGKVTTLKRVESQTLESGTQNWGPLGGGGKDVTYKNQFYTFDVTDDYFSIDAELESPDTDVALYVYDKLGQPLNTSYFGDRSKYVVLNLNKGSYSVMAATVKRGSIGNYNLRLMGKIQNLQRVQSQLTTIKGTWASNTAADTYSVELTPNSSPLDIDLTSAETECQIDLQNSSGTRLSYTALALKTNYLLGKNLSKATYLIKVYPGRVSGKPGNYTLNVIGQYTNFKKI